jgi:hypothetical protein
MRTFILVIVLLGWIIIAGCDGAGEPGRQDDAGAASKLGYGPDGVTADLGPNPCDAFVKHPECDAAGGVDHCGWDPSTGRCYPEIATELAGFVRPRVCEDIDWCAMYQAWHLQASLAPGGSSTGTVKIYAPGTIMIWSTPASQYLGNPDKSAPASFVCLPNQEAFAVTSGMIEHACP